MLTAIWIIAALLLGLWSLGAWGLHTLLAADTGWVGDLGELVDRVPYGELIDRWFPGWQALMHALLDLAQSTLGLLGGAAPLIVWAAWAVGATGIALVGGFLSLVVVLLRRDERGRAAA